MEPVDISVLETVAETVPQEITYIIEQTADLAEIESLLATSVELQGYIYTALLFCIGFAGAVGVCFLLYKALRKFA